MALAKRKTPASGRPGSRKLATSKKHPAKSRAKTHRSYGRISELNMMAVGIAAFAVILALGAGIWLFKDYRSQVTLTTDGDEGFSQALEDESTSTKAISDFDQNEELANTNDIVNDSESEVQ